jgi:sulfite reductase (NADPH) hemoprotein beta-component
MQTRTVTGRTRPSFASEADIDEFVRVLGQFERGEITADQWRSFRLVRGTYCQRQPDDAQMLRVKSPQGILTGSGLEALADVAERYSRGFAHITTRQNVQLHFMKLRDIEPAMRRLAEAGLTTREACGNSVRNITCCPLAGVAPDEPFDVTPYGEALTRHLLRHPLSAVLPRKFKIAFEGCPHDHIAAGINDIGFTARVRLEGGTARRGFRITVAGGTSTLAKSGQVLFEFCEAGEILAVADAILQVFHRLGDYQHRQRNRLKFLVRSLGWDGFHAEFAREYGAVRGTVPLPFDAEQPPEEEAPHWSRPQPPDVPAVASLAASTVLRGPGVVPRAESRLAVRSEAYLAWSITSVQPQKQHGYCVVTVVAPLGDVSATQLRVLALLAAAYSDGTVRMTKEQNLIMRWVPAAIVPEVFARLAAAGLDSGGAGTPRDVVSCPGAESCRLAVTRSRGLGRLLGDALSARPDITAALPALDIKISGCPNGCGQHHIAGIGFQGSLRKIGGRPAPHYFVSVGGGTSDGITTFGRVVGVIPARRAVDAVERLARLYTELKRAGEPPEAFFRRVDPAVAKHSLAPLEGLTPATATDDDFMDLGDGAAFAPEIMDGECSA